MELRIVKFFNRLGRGTFIDSVTYFISHSLALAIFWTITTIFIFFFAKNGILIATSLMIAAALHFIISEGFFKNILIRCWHKKRPYMAHPEEISPIGKQYSSSSFPSSHMSANVAVLVVSIHFFPYMLIVAVIFLVMTAFARLHNGMHYLSDIIAGIILGIAYGRIGIACADSIFSSVIS